MAEWNDSFKKEDNNTTVKPNCNFTKYNIYIAATNIKLPNTTQHFLTITISEDEERAITPDTWKHTMNDSHASENVVCLKSFDSILVGDKGTVRMHMLVIDASIKIYIVALDWRRWSRTLQRIMVKVEPTYRYRKSEYSYFHQSFLINYDRWRGPVIGIRNQTEFCINCRPVFHRYDRYPTFSFQITGLSTGIVRQIIGHDLHLKFVVDFPGCLGKICDLSHLRSVVKDYHNCQCQSCLKVQFCVYVKLPSCTWGV